MKRKMKLTDKVINAVYDGLQGPLKTPTLSKLTFGDLKTVGKQLTKFKKLSEKKKDKAFEQKACSACFPVGKLH